MQEICSEEPTGKRCLLILDIKPFRSQVKEKHPLGKERVCEERSC